MVGLAVRTHAVPLGGAAVWVIPLVDPGSAIRRQQPRLADHLRDPKTVIRHGALVVA